jgi:hypothetical protein
MSRFPVNRLMSALEVPARPFARCLVHYREKGHDTTRLFTALMGFMSLGPVSLFHHLAGISALDQGDWHFVLVCLVPLLVITVTCEMFISRFAVRLGSAIRPSLSDWLVFWGVPLAGPILFVFSSV